MPAPQYALKPKKEEKSIEETINQLKSNSAEEYVNIPELIFNGFEYIDDIKKEANNKENQLLILKKFIMEYNKIINYMNSLDETSDEIEAFKQLVKESSEKIEQLLSGNLEINEIEEVLSNVLTKTSEHYTKIIEAQKENYSNKNKTEINLPEEQKEDFIIPEINAAYEKLYEATLKNDIKKITLYRGRIIKLLQKNKPEIEKKYNEVECLDRLEQLVTSNAYSKEKVVEILSEEKNKK